MNDWTDFAALWLAVSGIVLLVCMANWWRGLSEEGDELRDPRFLLVSGAFLVGGSLATGLLLSALYVGLRSL